MADSTITVQGVLLRDNWPGVPIAPPVDYSDMTAAGVGHNKAAAAWRLGQKWKVYCGGDARYHELGYFKGWSTFIYLKNAADIESAVAGTTGSIVVVDGTMAAAQAADVHYIVTADSADTTHDSGGLMAVALSAMTNSYYAWYWCGGVCPIEYVPGFTTATTLVTDDSLVANCAMGTYAATSLDIALRAIPATTTNPVVGVALYADGT